MMYFCKPEFGTCVQTNRYEMAERRHITICGKSWYSREYECPVCHRRFIRKVDAWWAETSPLRKYKRCKACEGVAVVRGRKPRKVAKGYKHCRYCQETKVLCLFHRDRSARDGRSGRCVACAKEKRKRYYAAHKDAQSLPRPVPWQARVGGYIDSMSIFHVCISSPSLTKYLRKILLITGLI